MLMEKDMHSTAMHESSHAVMAWLTGGILKTITIAGEPDKPFFCTYGRSPWQEKTWLNRDNVHVTLAGAAVHEILGFDDPFESCNYDLESIADMLKHPDPETKAMREFAVHHPDSTAKEFAELFLPDLVDRLKDPKVMTCIEAGAAMLETATGDVCGRLMVELFEYSWGTPLPEGVAPAWMHWPPPKDDEAPTPAEALVMLGKAMDDLEKAIEATRTAFRFENEAAEKLAAKTLQFSFQARDLYQKIEIPLSA
jgi:hypothetical protein